MKIEQQVCSLELAKKLKELGIKQESLFYYNSETMELHTGFTSHIDKDGKMVWSISAFTVAELGEMLPMELRMKISKGYCKAVHPYHNEFMTFHFSTERNFDNTDWRCSYTFNSEDDEGMSHWVVEEGKNEADVRAKMLIYLLENKLITL